MNYSTSEIARIVGVHPNTIRLYEEIGFITPPERRPNGYRTFTEEHLLQVRLIRTALQVEIVQNNLRKEVIEMIKTMAKQEYSQAILLTQERLDHIKRDRRAAEEAVATVHDLITKRSHGESSRLLTRADAAKTLFTSIDSLRNWEMNGLFSAKRMQNGYRVYTAEDINRLRIIKVLRDANYSIAAIHRLFSQIEQYQDIDIRQALDTPTEEEDILSVCDKLLTSLDRAENNSYQMIELLHELKKIKPSS